MRSKESRTLQQLERELAAERARRQQAEARLASFTLRASENNSALARNNLRLQEQLARLRGESDLLSHEAGCQRAAAAAREQEAAHKLALLQQRLHAAEDEQRVLRRQLAGKQEIICYLESKLAERQSALWKVPPAVEGRLGTAVVALSSGDSSSEDSSSLTPAGEVVEEPSFPVQVENVRAADSFRSMQQHALEELRQPAQQHGAKQLRQAHGEVEEQPEQPEEELGVASTPAGKLLQVPGSQLAAQGAPSTAVRSSLRARKQVSYALPSLHSKLRKGDPFTFGEAAAGDDGRADGQQHSRARTKPRARLPVTATPAADVGGSAAPAGDA